MRSLFTVACALGAVLASGRHDYGGHHMGSYERGEHHEERSNHSEGKV